MAATQNFETCSNYSDCSSGCREIDPSHTHNAAIAAPVVSNMEDNFRLMSWLDNTLPAHAMPLTRENPNGPAYNTAPQAPVDGSVEYKWYCCYCGYGPSDTSRNPGCIGCNNHNRCSNCIVQAVKS